MLKMKLKNPTKLFYTQTFTCFQMRLSGTIAAFLLTFFTNGKDPHPSCWVSPLKRDDEFLSKHRNADTRLLSRIFLQRKQKK